MNTQELIILTLVLFAIYYLLSSAKEGLDAVMVTNAFSDLRCITDDLPIFRIIDNKSLQCLSKNQGDTTTCKTRADLGVDPNVKCNDINTHLVKQIRNARSSERKVFDELEKNVDYNLLTCHPDGLNDSSHWCGKIYDVVKNEKCNSNEGKFGLWSNPCKQMPEYATLPKQGSNTFTTTRAEILEAKDVAKLQTDISRNRALCGSNAPCRNELVLSSGGRNATTQCRMKIEDDGNLAIYDNANKKVWESQSGGKGPSPYKLLVQTDGTLAVADKDDKTIWNSGVKGPDSSSKLYRANLLQKAGKCVVEVTDKTNKPVWSSP
jgi:hypothetical protein